MTQITGNDNGRILEQQIEALLRSKGYVQTNQICRDGNCGPWYIRQYRGFRTIYGSQCRLDFLVRHPTKHPDMLAIECKWQSSPGTVDEKFPYLLANGRALGIPYAVFLAGGGYRDGAKQWILQQSQPGFIVIEGCDAVIRWAQVKL